MTNSKDIYSATPVFPTKEEYDILNKKYFEALRAIDILKEEIKVLKGNKE